ncbi:hypothetical protein DdX_10185 [Ditylenchus destructor]|uniref:Uncharacterized protein n=1 Tax=Ditylenchus destructor TaxID=166010 RepID=A0AAD4N4Q5_9BILA|nr:hypothetical protein DdX_10185 [Ditylenchus destructor]
MGCFSSRFVSTMASWDVGGVIAGKANGKHSVIFLPNLCLFGHRKGIDVGNSALLCLYCENRTLTEFRALLRGLGVVQRCKNGLEVNLAQERSCKGVVNIARDILAGELLEEECR